jgi:hypothetical protein
MGFFFRKSLGRGPFRINLSKSGVGFSLGMRGLRIGRSANGRTYTRASLPGTGIGWQKSGGKSGCLVPLAVATMTVLMLAAAHAPRIPAPQAVVASHRPPETTEAQELAMCSELSCPQRVEVPLQYVDLGDAWIELVQVNCADRDDNEFCMSHYALYETRVDEMRGMLRDRICGPLDLYPPLKDTLCDWDLVLSNTEDPDPLSIMALSGFMVQTLEHQGPVLAFIIPRHNMSRFGVQWDLMIIPIENGRLQRHLMTTTWNGYLELSQCVPDTGARLKAHEILDDFVEVKEDEVVEP